MGEKSSWRLTVKELSMQPQLTPDQQNFFSYGFGKLRRIPKKQSQIAEYYKKQEELIESFIEMETVNETSYLHGGLAKDDMKQLSKNERFAINLSLAVNLVLLFAKVYASVASKSLAVVASALDSLIDLLAGVILWFTAHAMTRPNQYQYPIGKKRMQPVGIIVFASVTATLGLEILVESGRQLVDKSGPEMSKNERKWLIGIMVSVTLVKFALMVYCRRFKNEIVRAYALDHFFDVITSSGGLAIALLAVKFYWWIDPIGAISIALYTIHTWSMLVIENVGSLIGRSAPPNFLARLTYFIWNHHEDIKHINTVRAYTFGTHFFVEVDIVLPENIQLIKSHDIGETLRVKIEQLPEVERAFV